MSEHRDSPTANAPSSALHQAQNTDSSLGTRLYDVLTRVYDLGFIGFGGSPVNIQMVHRRFVDGIGGPPWIDEQTFQELFVIVQALPGPGATKMLFSVTQVHAGVAPALLAFVLWMLPGACIMYALSLGIQQMGIRLPSPAYALLSGLNAATVGGIALAAVQLSRRAITDPLTRALVLLGACAGLCYNALWYYPVLIFLGGFSTLVWDSRELLFEKFGALPESETRTPHQYDNNVGCSLEDAHSRVDVNKYSPSVTLGMIVTIALIVVFIALLILRSIMATRHPALDVFTNFYFAGVLIIGGGPVVTPLLREYIVEPGWVSPRDFLLGLAIVQALPGPNFNFAVYLGSLALAGHEFSIKKTLLGAFLGALGIFSPGIFLSIATQSGWYLLKNQPAVVRLLRGMNATAVGLVFTAVYRLWRVGYLRPGHGHGSSLAEDPWWLAVAAITYTCIEWYGIPIPVAIVAGGVAGLAWWNVISPSP